MYFQQYITGGGVMDVFVEDDAGEKIGDMKTENERQFLVENLESLPDLSQFERIEIRQGYLSIANNGNEHRIRQEDGKFYSIIKRGRGQKRLESPPVEITREQFERLWPLTANKRIWKTRYRIPYGEVTIELDIYWRQLRDLILPEVEFDHDEQSRIFVPPDWFGREVTGDKRYNDQHLAVYGQPSQVISLLGDDPVFDLATGVKKLAEVIKADRDARPGASTIVLGGSGSCTGKTDMVMMKTAKELGSHGITSVLISADNYNKGKKWKDAKKARGNKLTWDDPPIYDYRELFRVDLPKLMAGTQIKKRIFSFGTNEPEWALDKDGSEEHIPPADVIFIEGLHILDDEWADYGHIKVFIDTSMHGRLIRRLMRDVKRTKLTPYEILRMFLAVVEPKHREFVEPTRKNADLVIRNEYVPEIESKRCENFHQQMKFRTDSTGELPKAAGATRMSDMFYQKDYYFFPPGRDFCLIGSGDIIRIRDDHGAKSINYKGSKSIINGCVHEPILSVEIDEKTEEMFRALYGEETGMIVKFRTWYRLDGIDFSFNAYVNKIVDGHVFHLGNFIELIIAAKDSEETLRGVMSKLRLRPEDRTEKSYIEM
jgi:adenylate cyclase